MRGIMQQPVRYMTFQEIVRLNLSLAIQLNWSVTMPGIVAQPGPPTDNSLCRDALGRGSTIPTKQTPKRLLIALIALITCTL